MFVSTKSGGNGWNLPSFKSSDDNTTLSVCKDSVISIPIVQFDVKI